MKKVSVCVPTYNRPEMVGQLIKTYLYQDYPNRELVISDDSSNDSVERVTMSFNDPSIKYFKNSENLGYCENLLVALERATGDYIVILGDDDLLLKENTLSRYARTFDENDETYYIYCNSVQISNDLKVDLLRHYFSEDTYINKGKEAMCSIWLYSTFIPGMGLRNKIPFRALYPDHTMLYPQVEMVGHIINTYDSYGLSDFLVAGRAHDEQLGFKAVLGERVKGGELHGNVEIYQIFEYLKDKYSLDLDDTFISVHQIRAYMEIMLKEKMFLGNKYIKLNYRNFCEMSDVARRSLKLKASYYIALVLPGWAIGVIRFFYLKKRSFRDRELIKQVDADLARKLL